MAVLSPRSGERREQSPVSGGIRSPSAPPLLAATRVRPRAGSADRPVSTAHDAGTERELVAEHYHYNDNDAFGSSAAPTRPSNEKGAEVHVEGVSPAIDIIPATPMRPPTPASPQQQPQPQPQHTHSPGVSLSSLLAASAVGPSSATGASAAAAAQSRSPARTPLPFNTGASEIARMHHETPEALRQRQIEAAMAASHAAGFLTVEVDKKDGSVASFGNAAGRSQSPSALHLSAGPNSITMAGPNSTTGQQQWLRHNDSYFSGNSAYNFYNSAGSGANSNGGGSPSQLATLAMPPIPLSSSAAMESSTAPPMNDSLSGGGLLNTSGRLARIKSALGLGGGGGSSRSPSQHPCDGDDTDEPPKSVGSANGDPSSSGAAAVPSSVVVRVVKRSEAKAAQQEFERQERHFARERERCNGRGVGGGPEMDFDVTATVNESTLGLGFGADGGGGGGPKSGGGGGDGKKRGNGGSRGGGGNSSLFGPSAPLEMPTTLTPPKSDPLWGNARRLYVTYFFSAWAHRMWEFGAIVFIMDGLFPDSLLASSLFGLFEAAAGMATAGPSGALIDRSDRMRTVRIGILSQNLSIIVVMGLLAAAMWSGGPSLALWPRIGVLVAVIAFGMVGKFGSLLHRMAVMKDWLVVIAGDSRPVLSELNAHMRRTDMACQIFAPLCVGVASAWVGGAVTCVLIAVWSLVSIVIELRLSTVVYAAVPALSAPRNVLSHHAFPSAMVGMAATGVNDGGEYGGLGGGGGGGQFALSSIVSAIPPGPIVVSRGGGVEGPPTYASSGAASTTEETVAVRKDTAGGPCVSSAALHVASTSQTRSSSSVAALTIAPPATNPTKIVGTGSAVTGSGSPLAPHRQTSVGARGREGNDETEGEKRSSVIAAEAVDGSMAAPNFAPVNINDSLSVRFDNEGNRVGFGCGTIVRRINGSLRRTAHAWAVYRAHPCFWISIPYALLSISVLSFGGIMVAFLKTQGCSDGVLSIGRSVGSFISIIPTFAVPYLIPRKGLFRTGKYMLWSQVATLAPIVLAMLFGLQRAGNSADKEIGKLVDPVTGAVISERVPEGTPLLFVIIVFVCVCASRFGIWGFDLAQMQMMQELVDKAETGRVNGSQELVVNACWLASFVLTIIFHNPALFVWPALVSFLAIFVAAIIYTFVGMRTAEAKREAMGGAAAAVIYA